MAVKKAKTNKVKGRSKRPRVVIRGAKAGKGKKRPRVKIRG